MSQTDVSNLALVVQREPDVRKKPSAAVDKKPAGAGPKTGKRRAAAAFTEAAALADGSEEERSPEEDPSPEEGEEKKTNHNLELGPPRTRSAPYCTAQKRAERFPSGHFGSLWARTKVTSSAKMTPENGSAL